MLRRIRSRSVAIAILLAFVFEFLRPLAAEAPNGVTLAPTPSPTAGQPGIQIITLTGSGFPSGTINPAAVTIHLTPAPPATGPSGQTPARAVATVLGSTRRVTFQIPASINVSSPTPYLVTIEGTTTGGTAFQSGNASTLVVNPAASIASVASNAAFQGASLQVTITGQFTNFVHGATQAAFGAGIQVGDAPAGAFGPVTVLSPTQARAQLTIDPAAALGPRDVQVQTGVQHASKATAFTVLGATVESLTPSQLTVAAGGGTGTLTVNLRNPNPNQAMHVALSSTNAGVASVPTEVVISAGLASGTFQVTGGTAGGPVTITASLNNTSATAQVGVQQKPAPPVVTGPLAKGSITVGGTAIANALVDVFVNGVPAGMSTADGIGHFMIPVAALVAGQQVTATQTVNGVTSDPSAPVTVQPLPAAPIVTAPLVAGQTSVSGTAQPNADVHVFVDGSQVPDGTAGGSGAFNIAVPTLVAGQQVTATQTVGGLTSNPSAPVLVVSQVPPPVVNSPIVAGTTSVSGTGTNGAEVTVFVNDVAVVGTTTVSNGTWTKTDLTPLAAGDKVKAQQKVGLTTSGDSNVVTVVPPTPPPTVNSPLVAGAISVSGTGATGRSIEVFVDSGSGFVSVGTTTVAGDMWTKSDLTPLNPGDKVKAQQTANGVPSVDSNIVTVVPPTPPPTVTSPIVAGATSVSGTGSNGATVEVFVDRGSGFQSEGTTTVMTGAWTLALGTALSGGNQVKARQTLNGVTSGDSNIVTVGPPPPPTVDAPILAGATTVTGTGIPSATIEVFRNGTTSLGTTAVTGVDTWSKTVPALTAGDKITAKQTVAGTTSGPSNEVTVGAPTLVSITITPAPTAAIDPGQAVQFTAKGTFLDGTVVDPLPGVQWESDTLAVLTINAGGLAMGVGPGTAKVRASRDGVQSPETTVTVGLPAPSIASISPDSGEPGTEVTIKGSGFDPSTSSNQVTFGGVAAQVTNATTTELKARVPATAMTGEVRVANARGTATGPVFTVRHREDFRLTVTPVTTTLLQGSSITAEVRLENAGTNPFTGLAELTISGLPQGTTANFVPQTLSLNQVGVVTFVASPGATQGTFPLTFSGTGLVSGVPQTRSASMNLTIQQNVGVTGARGRFVDPQGRGIGGIIVKIEPSNQTTTDAAGNFLLTNVPAGNVTLRMDATPANPQYPIWPFTTSLEAGKVTQFADWVITPPPSEDKFKPLIPASNQDQIITDSRFPGVEVKIPAGTTIIGWGADGVPKTKIAIERIDPDRLPVDPPPVGAKSLYQLFFGTPMGGMTSKPILVTAPNEFGLEPGQKADLYYYDGIPMGPSGSWQKAGTGTVSADGKTIITDPGSGIPRFCGVCGLWCFLPSFFIPNPPCPDCDVGGPRAKEGVNPITLALGMELTRAVDLYIDGIMPITIARVYHPYDLFVKSNALVPSMGHGWQFSYDVIVFPDPNSSVVRMILPANARVDFSPAAQGDYESPTDLRFGGARLSQPSGQDRWELRYKDGRKWVFAKFGFVYYLVEQRDSNGNVLHIERRGDGRPTTITAPGRSVAIGIGTNGFITVIRDALGREVIYDYSLDDRIKQVIAPDGGLTHYTYKADNTTPMFLSVSPPGGLGPQASLSLSPGTSAGSPRYIETVQYPGSDRPVIMDYSPNFRVLRQTVPGMTSYSFAYHLSGTCAFTLNQLRPGFPLTCAGPNGPTVDSWQNFQAGWRFLGGTISAVTVTDGRENSYTVRFNGAGLGTEYVDPLGQVTKYERDARNRIVAITDPLGRATRLDYDANNNVTRVTEPPGRTTDYTYHPKWNKITSVTRKLEDGTPITYLFEYDEAETGNLLRALDPLGNKTSYMHNARGQVQMVTNPLGHKNTLTYNDVGDLVSIADPLGNSVSMSYDLVGRLTALTDALGASTRTEFNALDQMTRIIDANGGITRFTYDAKRDPVAVIDPLNRVESYEADVLHRLIRRTDAKGASETYRYHPTGSLLSSTDRKGQTVSTERDRLDRVIRLTYADGEVEIRQYDAAGRLVHIEDRTAPIAFEYDALNRLVRETSEGASVNTRVEYQYDNLDRRVLRIVDLSETRYAYDAASRLVRIDFQGQQTTYEWDQVGRLVVKTLPNGIRQELSYDDTSRILDMTYRKPDRSIIGHLTYGYDANGRRVSRTSTFGSAGETPFIAMYDEANRMSNITVGVAGESHRLDYDANGNVVSRVGSDGARSYRWDSRNRLVGATSPTFSAAFVYDSLSRRIQRTVNGETIRYVYDGLQAVSQRGVSSRTEVLTGLRLDDVVARYTQTGTRVFITDVLDSVIAQATELGEVDVSYVYSPYGESHAQGREDANPIRFTAREDDQTGLYYYRARYYDPLLKRFLSEDPLSLGKLQGITNSYAYAFGSPTVYGDPTGEVPVHLILSGALLLGLYEGLRQEWRECMCGGDPMIGFSRGFIKGAVTVLAVPIMLEVGVKTWLATLAGTLAATVLSNIDNPGSLDIVSVLIDIGTAEAVLLAGPGACLVPIMGRLPSRNFTGNGARYFLRRTVDKFFKEFMKAPF